MRMPQSSNSKTRWPKTASLDNAILESFRAKVQAWVVKTNLPLAIIAMAYLGTYSLEVVFIGSPLADLGKVGSTFIWWIFLLDLLLRLAGARSLPSFFKSNVLEIATLVLPFLRMLRMFRVLLALRALKNLSKDRLHATGIYVALLLPFIWYSGAVAVLDAESSSAVASIRDLGDALWWSLSTITTVGYGDLYPTTIEGKVVAATLMLTGIGLYSAVAGMFGTWIMRDRKIY